MTVCPYCGSDNWHYIGAELDWDNYDVFLVDEYWCNQCDNPFQEASDWLPEDLNDETRPTNDHLN